MAEPLIVTFDFDESELVTLIERMSATSATWSDQLRRRVLKALERPDSLFRVRTLEDDGLATAPAASLRIVLEPSQRLLKLAAACGASDRHGDISHGGSPGVVD